MPTWFFGPGAVIVGWLTWLLGGVRVEGLGRVPRRGAFVAVVNHCSNMDPLIVGLVAGYRTRRIVHFMAKVEVRGWPLIGWLASQSGGFFVRRGEGDRAAQRQALELLAAGAAVVMFPEGTRSRDGQFRPDRVRPGAALLAIRSGAPVVPMGIAGTHQLFPARSRIPRRSRMTVRIGEPFALPHVPDGRVDRAALAEATDRIVREIAALVPQEQGGTVRR